MSEQQRDEASQNNDLRVKTTAIIWTMTLPMMAVSIPLTAIADSGVLIPLSVLCTAAISTIAVWMRSGSGAARPSAHEIALQSQVHELEERLASLEGITNFEHRLLEAKYPNAAPVILDTGSASHSPVSPTTAVSG